MTQRRRVALVIESSNEYARGVLHGVVCYVREHRPWSLILTEQGRGARPPKWLAEWDGDGIIARIENQVIAEAIALRGLPTVDVSAARLVPELPWIETDDRAIAAAAVEHFLQRGFRSFAFYGDDRFNWSKWRQESFVGLLKARGHDCAYFSPRRGTRGQARSLEALATWLKDLPKPVGILACYDVAGQRVLDACRHAELRVPDEVAVLGVDDDPLLCDLSDPPLSSVRPNSRRTGYEAASLLDRLMRGETAEATELLIEPLGVAVRQSTDVLAVDDSDIAKAVHYIREHARDGIRVVDVLEQVPLSRRVFESRFQKLLGRTPHEEIQRVQLEFVKHLLAATDLNLAVIADRSGFRHAEYLSVVFKKKVGQTPGRYRRDHQV